jgi:serine/threonine protein kinase
MFAQLHKWVELLQPPLPSRTADPSTMGPPLDPIASLRLALRGHYDIEREIGQGAFATVYLARDLKHERKVAVKVLHADPTSETGELRFIREIRLLARLQHPNILPLHDSGHVEALLYYVMPYVGGETLCDRIDREKQLPIEIACSIARDVADALAYAHGQGIIHRDIKPENILLSAGHPILADFGIARVIDLAGVRQVTRTGAASPGTPAYMSPEQLMGDKELDGRSDTYSLGCVLFEMLTGKPPFNGKEGFVKRFTEPPPSPVTIRKDLPSWMADVVMKALARSPNDRYQTAQEFATALTVGSKAGGDSRASASEGGKQTHVGPALPGQLVEAERGPPPRERSRDRWLARLNMTGSSAFIILSLVAIAVAPATFSAVKRQGWTVPGLKPSVDSSLFVVLPFAGPAGASGNVGGQAADALYEALQAWEGLNLVPDLKVSEAVVENGRAPATLSEALAVARRLGAGHLVWGHVVARRDSVLPRAELYDLTRPTRSTKEVLIDSKRGSSAYAAAAMQLLALPNRPTAALGGDGLTRNYAAWQAYNRGHIALRRWDLASAHDEFEEAVQADASYPVARLWLGQILAWQAPAATERWREHAERSALAASRLNERDRLLAVGLGAMARKQYPIACDSYLALTRADSSDFVGWYGLGECQALDRAVLPDGSSPSSWRWRSSYDAAVKSFAHALRLEPGAHALLSFERLRRLLPTAATNPRTDNPENPAFAAYPSLAGDDTLAFVPYPVSVFAKGLPPSATATLNRALDHNLDVLFELASRWVQLAPLNPDAYESLAEVLETRGNIDGGAGPAGSATAAVRQAMLLSSDPQQRMRLAVREGILRFRRGDYAGARKSADSLFAQVELVDRNTPPVLISLAALTGKIGVMAKLAQSGVGPDKLDGIAIPRGLTEVSAALFATAALGVCGDTLTALRDRLEQQIQSSVAEGQRAAARSVLATRSLGMMVPCTQGASALDIPSPTTKLHRLQHAFARKDANGVRSRLLEIAESRRPLRPTDWSLDIIYQETWVRAATGDTLGAIAQLDRSLNSISALNAPALKEAAASAAVGRAMALRADLADKTGDHRAARHWARAVSELWASADAPLQPTVSRMKMLATRPR